ncbi:hypothetical protein FACS1894168_2510 [Deltaproteobacteria bacterium]|nr:hypothetical protein FACS1894168_2510 [Deltaproteobacteria bacterium]
MGILAFKLTLTPLLIALCTLAARRWGPVVGGLIVGLPLTSGPVSIFLAVEHGGDFAAAAAIGTILGDLSVIAYCLAYARAAQKFSWPGALFLALVVYGITGALLSFLSFSLSQAALFAILLITAALAVEKKRAAKAIAITPPKWDIPFRMAAATTVVLIVTALSSRLGPHISGVFSAFPVFLSVMFAFSHKLCGPESTRPFARGIILGSFSFEAFFIVVALAAQNTHPALVYLLAALTAIGVNLATMALVMRRSAR